MGGNLKSLKFNFWPEKYINMGPQNTKRCIIATFGGVCFLRNVDLLNIFMRKSWLQIFEITIELQCRVFMFSNSLVNFSFKTSLIGLLYASKSSRAKPPVLSVGFPWKCLQVCCPSLRKYILSDSLERWGWMNWHSISNKTFYCFSCIIVMVHRNSPTVEI